MSTIKAANIQNPSAASAAIVLDTSGNFSVPAGTVSAPGIQAPSDSNTGIFFPAADTIAFAEGGSEAMRIDSSSRLLVGTSTARSGFFNGAGGTDGRLLVETTSNINAFCSVYSAANDGGSYLVLAKQRSGSIGGFTAPNSGDEIGGITFQGADGADFVEAARIQAFADGSCGSNNMPGKLVFSTTPSGTASVQQKFSISQDGRAELPNCIYFRPTDNATNLGTATNRWAVVYAVNGTINTSDGRQKTDISTSSLGTDFVKALRPVSYKWIEGGKVKTGKFDEDGNNIYEAVPGKRTHWGFIAQEVKQAVDAAGVDFGGWVLDDLDDPDSQQSLRYDQFIAPLTKALQEALERIETLEAEIAAFKAQ